MVKGVVGGCPFKSCGATNPRINSVDLSKLPEEVQQELKESGLAGGGIKSCGYCGNIWVRSTDYSGKFPEDIITPIGIDNHVANKGMVWIILDKEKSRNSWRLLR